MAHIILLLAFVIQADSASYGVQPCEYAKQYRQLNLPATITSQSTEILHAAAVSYQSRSVGWLYETVRGQLFYQDGPLDTSKLRERQPAQIATTVIEAFGLKPNLKHIQVGSFYTVTGPPRLAPLANKEIELKGCY